MKKITLLGLICFLLFLSYSKSEAQMHINIINGFGYNIIDFEKLLGVPYWDANNSPYDTQITSDSPLVYKGGVQITFDVLEKLRIGGEVGVNRLYYVEERYSVLMGNDDEFRWRMYDIWTLNVGGLGQLFVTENIYLQSGVGIHNFLDGSGVALGAMAGIGYEVPINEKFSVPVEFRNDWVFGDVLSGVFSLVVGFSIN